MATIWRDKEPQFIPYPQKWLNQRMYLEQCHVPGDPLMLPHRDAGKILYRADGSRFRREADGSATELPPEDES